jgi:hypothetical protein
VRGNICLTGLQSDAGLLEQLENMSPQHIRLTPQCCQNVLEPLPLAPAHGNGSSSLSSRASSPIRVFRRERDLL